MFFRVPRGYRSRWSYLITHFKHRWPRILFLLALLYILLLLNERKHPFTKHAHTITPLSVSFIDSHLSSLSTSNDDKSPLTISATAAESFCRAHRFVPLPLCSPSSLSSKFRSETSITKRKVYDLTLLNTELDWLEIRLAALFPVVDYFIIVESPLTFTGHDKPLLLKENWSRFEPYHSKIIHHILENPPKNAKRTWDVEDFQRNAMFTQTFPKLEGEKKATKGDILVVSDVDEIPRPATMVLLRTCDVPRRVTIRSMFYYYGFMWLHAGPQWGHGQATIFQGVEEGTTILPADLRNGEGGGFNWFWLRRWWETAEIWNAGWHCSTCFEKIEEVLGKMGSFSHVGLNQEGYRDRGRIVDRVRNGKDLWDRKGEVFERVDGNEDIPKVLLGDKKRWAYLLDRDGENAGFVDYKKDG